MEKKASKTHVMIIIYQNIGQGSDFTLRLGGDKRRNQKIIVPIAPKRIHGFLTPHFSDHFIGLSVRYPARGSLIIFHIAYIANESPTKRTGKPITTS